MSTDEVTFSFESEGSSGVQWKVVSGVFTEKLSAPYSLWLQLETEETFAEPIQMLGKSCTLVADRGKVLRQVTGIVIEVQEGSTHPELLTTNITVVPALEVLRHRVNTKIFQDMTVPEILEEVLAEALGSYDRSVELRLNRTYPTCEYRTQYDESDLAFCTRLMEEEGIAYFFEFDGAAEKLILSDTNKNFIDIECHQTDLASNTLLFSQYEGGVGEHEYVSSFQVVSQLRPTKVVTRHFDWTRPSEAVEADSTAFDEGGGGALNGATLSPDREVYQHDSEPLTFHEYDGLAYPKNDKDDQVKLRREASAFDSRIIEGHSTALGVTAAKTFDLFGHPQSDLDSSYLLLSVTHTFEGTGHSYQNDFVCIPAAVTFRPKRRTPKPVIPNVQTAIVVGPSGQEIHTDVHGRVKVQFHWDRLGQMDEHSSCWIRVMQPWGGKAWGFFFIPRIGMEVVVHFIDGDPDRPLVAGSVYNGDHAPPYKLPDEKTKSTLKSESTIGGGGFNELRFDDNKDNEEIYVHAQKDYNEVVENDHYTLVHHDQINEVDNIHTEKVHVDQHLIVDQHRNKTVKGNETTTVKGTRTETVSDDETITLEKNRTTDITSNDTLTVGEAGKQDVGTTYDLTAGQSITFTSGASSITLQSDGTIEIKGTTVKINGASLIEQKGGLITLN